MKWGVMLLALFFLTSCQELIDAPVPDLSWKEFDAIKSNPLSASQRQFMEGVYAIGEQDDDFGNEAVLKWSYTVIGTDTTHYLSFFCSEDVRYFICQAKQTDTAILLNGYWRNIENTKTGKAHFTLSKKTVNGSDVASQKSILLSGLIGRNDDKPERKISFRYLRPLYKDSTNYLLIAHRGGGRNNDLLPASENSLEMILLASQLGANGIEIDVQLTKDSVPVLFHDAQVNDRLTTKTGIHGPVDSYTYQELHNESNLKRGGKVPTLKEALQTVLQKTPLNFVWLDCKYKEAIPIISKLQMQFCKLAEDAGRKLYIVIGLPDDDVIKAYMQLPGYENKLALCEGDTAALYQSGAIIWGQTWIKGHQDEELAAIHKRGKKAVAWTIDIPRKIKEFIYESKFNGICTNRPTMAAYYYYAKQ